MSLDPTGLTDLADGRLGWWAVLVAGALSLAEAILGVGFVLPGETALTALAAASSRDKLPLMILAATLGASAGDHLNYGLGRRFGDRLPRSRLVRRVGVRHWDRGAELVRTHSGSSLILCRLVPVVRTVTPAVAGVVRLRYRTFLVGSLAGCLLWSTIWVVAGTLIGELLRDHPVLTVAGGVLALASTAVALTIRRHRRRPDLLSTPVPRLDPEPTREPALRP